MNELSDMPEPFVVDEAIKANLVWDVIEHSQVTRMLDVLKMVPPSPEGMEMAHMDSHVRLLCAEPAKPYIQVLAPKIAEIYIAAMLGDAAKEQDEELEDNLISQYTEFLGVGIHVAVANLVASGILMYNKDQMI